MPVGDEQLILPLCDQLWDELADIGVWRTGCRYSRTGFVHAFLASYIIRLCDCKYKSFVLSIPKNRQNKIPNFLNQSCSVLLFVCPWILVYGISYLQTAKIRSEVVSWEGPCLNLLSSVDLFPYWKLHDLTLPGAWLELLSQLVYCWALLRLGTILNNHTDKTNSS